MFPQPDVPEPMRILQVCSADTLGGGEVHVIQLVEELRRRGHHLEVAGRSGGPVPIEHELPFSNSADGLTALRLRRIVRRGRFDVVHAHIARDYPVAAAALLGFRHPKLICTRQLIHRVARNPLYRRVDGWIATTRQIQRTLDHLKPRRLEVIPNWTDCQRFSYRQRPLRDPVVIGLLGQVSPHKGHDDAITMIGQLGEGFRLLVGGTGREDYVATLRARARNLPVVFAGFVEPVAFLERIDVLVLPSSEEPFGIVILEAMAAGVNVVATNAGGPPEILGFGNAGLLVPPKRPGEMAEAVRTLIADRPRAAELRRSARERVVGQYDIARVVPRIEQFYRSVCGVR